MSDVEHLFMCFSHFHWRALAIFSRQWAQFFPLHNVSLKSDAFSVLYHFEVSAQLQSGLSSLKYLIILCT